ncbi:uncharacterized protein F5147DRAFT_723459 [Suillus discolor]|uniref:Hydrophobin n=1 Tax=Suillus discolor TaxID=1912936 RepID=A0A9P7EUG3_9AGAM|nr:uncharacterized protein F5147DRAFT_723459 [Suillus discolor]KAG2091486.1 hypothetical protein F5147DRAFT_723459 [Suillus discolor]
MTRLSFVLAVVAAFKLSVSVSPPSIDTPCAILCNTTADCCAGEICEQVVYDRQVSMSSFHLYNPVTHWLGRAMSIICVGHSDYRDSGSCSAFALV